MYNTSFTPYKQLTFSINKHLLLHSISKYGVLHKKQIFQRREVEKNGFSHNFSTFGYYKMQVQGRMKIKHGFPSGLVET